MYRYFKKLIVFMAIIPCFTILHAYTPDASLIARDFGGGFRGGFGGDRGFHNYGNERAFDRGWQDSNRYHNYNNDWGGYYDYDGGGYAQPYYYTNYNDQTELDSLDDSVPSPDQE